MDTYVYEHTAELTAADRAIWQPMNRAKRILAWRVYVIRVYISLPYTSLICISMSRAVQCKFFFIFVLHAHTIIAESRFKFAYIDATNETEYCDVCAEHQMTYVHNKFNGIVFLLVVLGMNDTKNEQTFDFQSMLFSACIIFVCLVPFSR